LQSLVNTLHFVARQCVAGLPYCLTVVTARTWLHVLLLFLSCVFLLMCCYGVIINDSAMHSTCMALTPCVGQPRWM